MGSKYHHIIIGDIACRHHRRPRRLTSLTATWARGTPAARGRHPIGRLSVAGIKPSESESASRESHARGAHTVYHCGSGRSQLKKPTSAAAPAAVSRSRVGGFGGSRTQRREDAVAAGQGVGVERRGGRRCLRHRRRQPIRVPRRHPAALRRPLHQFLHQVRPSIGNSVPPFFSSALNRSDLCPVEFLVSWPRLD